MNVLFVQISSVVISFYNIHLSLFSLNTFKIINFTYLFFFEILRIIFRYFFERTKLNFCEI